MSNPLYLIVGLLVALSYPLGVEPLRFADGAVGLRVAAAAVAVYAVLAWGVHRALVPGRSHALGIARLALRWLALVVYTVLVYLFHFPLWVWSIGLEESTLARPLVTLAPLLALFSVLALVGARFDPRRESFGGAVAFAFRGFVGFSLVPVLVMLGMDAAVERAAWLRRASFLLPAVGWGIAGAGMLAMVALLTFLLRIAFGAHDLEAGPLRDRMERLCRSTGFRCRDLLVMGTGGARLANAFIVKIAGPARYVFFTDAILAGMPADLLESVLAHEIAHSRRGHLRAFLAAMLGFSLLNAAALGAMEEAKVHPLVMALLVAAVAASFWIGIFGWVSRRFESEADLAAAKTSPGGARGMAAALGCVAELNRIPSWAWSWRHFSIAERVDLLLATDANPAGGEAFERRCARWRAAAVAFLVAGVAVAGWVAVEQLPRVQGRSRLYEAYARADRGGELLQEKRYGEAVIELREALRSGVDAAQAWLWIAECERALGHGEAARDAEDEALRKGVTDPRDRKRLAR